MNLVDLITDRVLLDDGCWLWTRPVLNNGYGYVAVGGGRRTGAHRAVYELMRGPIPKGMVIDHRCHNDDPDCNLGNQCPHRRCVKPDHMVIATRGNNSRRGRGTPARNLAKSSCPAGHPYTHVDRRGWRKCATCMSAQQTARARARGVRPSRRGATECIHGHTYTPENTRISNGKRHCRECDRISVRAFNAKRPRKPCQGCGGPKEPGRCRRYCLKCRPVPNEPSEAA